MPEAIRLSADELALTPEYSSDYNALVRPHLRFTTTRYFAERWAPTLGLYYRGVGAGPLTSAGKAASRTAWLILQLRQIVYWDDHEAVRGEHACRRSLDFLERESGLRRDTIQDILAEPLCQWFIHRQSGEHYYDPKRKHPVRAQNAYQVRMDEPLIPADAEYLAQELASYEPAATESLARALERVRWALQQPREQLRAADLRRPLRQPELFMRTHPVEVLDLVQLVEPGLAEVPADDEHWKDLLAACDALSEHLVAPQNVLGASYYFRKHWVKALGRGQAWLVMLLRDRCYDRPGDEVRDVCWVPDYDWLAQRVGVDTRTIGGWLNDGLQGFVQIREQRKGWDKTDPQRVGYRVKVQLHDPLTPEDEQEYQRRLANRLAAVEKGRVSAESGLSAPGVRRENAPPEGVRQENGLSKPGVGRESGLSAGGVTRETGPSAERGSGENPSGRESFKVPMIQRESQNNQTSPSKTIFDPIYAALGKLAANDDDGVDLEAVLVGVGVQNPSRKRILKTQPQAGLVLAWILAATSHTSVKQPVAFLVSKLLDPEEAAHPPAPFDVLARLSPKDWTAFALAARRRLAGEEPPWGLNGNAAAFETWWEVYGVAETLWLPLGLGDEAAKLWEEENDGQTAVAVGRARFGKWAADYS